MDCNRESILDELNSFEKRPTEISPLLEEYLQKIAKTGDTMFPWPKLKPLLKKKTELVLDEFYESCPTDNLPVLPNVENFKYDVLKNKIIEALDLFQSAPFTIQRICELLTAPRKHYKHTDKFMRGLEKNILVVSTIEPKSLTDHDMNSNHNPNLMVNGLITGALNDVDVGNSILIDNEDTESSACEAQFENFTDIPPTPPMILTEMPASNKQKENGEQECDQVVDMNSTENCSMDISPFCPGNNTHFEEENMKQENDSNCNTCSADQSHSGMESNSPLENFAVFSVPLPPPPLPPPPPPLPETHTSVHSDKDSFIDTDKDFVTENAIITEFTSSCSSHIDSSLIASSVSIAQECSPEKLSNSNGGRNPNARLSPKESIRDVCFANIQDHTLADEICKTSENSTQSFVDVKPDSAELSGDEIFCQPVSVDIEGSPVTFTDGNSAIVDDSNKNIYNDMIDKDGILAPLSQDELMIQDSSLAINENEAVKEENTEEQVLSCTQSISDQEGINSDNEDNLSDMVQSSVTVNILPSIVQSSVNNDSLLPNIVQSNTSNDNLVLDTIPSSVSNDLLTSMAQSSSDNNNFLPDMVHKSADSDNLLPNMVQGSADNDLLPNMVQNSASNNSLLTNIIQSSADNDNLLSNIVESSAGNDNLLPNIIQSCADNDNLLPNIIQSNNTDVQSEEPEAMEQD